jgi:hypothetical protein
MTRTKVLFSAVAALIFVAGCANSRFELSPDASAGNLNLTSLRFQPATSIEGLEAPTELYDRELEAAVTKSEKLHFTQDSDFVLFSEITEYDPGSLGTRQLIAPFFLLGVASHAF